MGASTSRTTSRSTSRTTSQTLSKKSEPASAVRTGTGNTSQTTNRANTVIEKPHTNQRDQKKRRPLWPTPLELGPGTRSLTNRAPAGRLKKQHTDRPSQTMVKKREHWDRKPRPAKRLKKSKASAPASCCKNSRPLPG